MTARAVRTGALLTLLCLLGSCILVQPRVHFEEPLAKWVETAERLRELTFVRTFRFRPLVRSEVGGVLKELIESSYPPAYVDAYRDAYAALGLLPADLELAGMLVKLQQDQLVGLYDPGRETLYVLSDPSDDALSPEATLVHELVHALQHQHFPASFAFQQGLRHNDDVVSALAAALEGDASLTMLGVREEESLRGRDVATAEQLRDAMLLDLRYPSGMLAQVPRLMRVSLLFPYIHGTLLAARRYAEAGNRGLDALDRNPPLSTLQFLRPESGATVEFIRLPLEELRARLEPRRCETGHHNVAGAITLQVLFEDFAAGLSPGAIEALVAGWTGDRFLHVSCPEGWEVAWLLRWRDPPAARAFAARYGDLAESLAAATPLSGSPQVRTHGRTALVLTPGLAPFAALLREESEIRAYASLREWVDDDCFPESPCPGAQRAPPGSPRARGD